MKVNRQESVQGIIGTLLYIFAAVVLTSCTTLSGGEPGWVSNPKTAYPDDLYLAAVGAGDTRRSAENAATASLSRIFESHIESDERVLDQIHETTTRFERTTDFSSDVNILSSQTLYNIQHAEAWKDGSGRYHAVAYLDRRETAAIYRDKIDELTGRVHFTLTLAEQADNLLDRYAQLRAANRRAAENDRLLRQLRVIHPPTASASAPDYSISEIHKALADTARQIRVQIHIEGDTDGRMTACIEELITRYGFVLGTPTVLEIAGRVAITDDGQRTADLVFVRYELAVQIKDTGGIVLAAVNNKGREAHQSQTEARSRSFRTMERAITTEGVQRLDAFFDALTDQSR